MSAVLDNMTTAIVMVMLIRRIIPEQKERWLFASIIIIAANSGGAWSPIGDVTTIMLWVKGNVTSVPLVGIAAASQSRFDDRAGVDRLAVDARDDYFGRHRGQSHVECRTRS